jgi:hypothetical protein
MRASAYGRRKTTRSARRRAIRATPPPRSARCSRATPTQAGRRGQKDVVEVQDHALRQTRQDIREQPVEIRPRHQDMRGVDEEDVAGGEVSERIVARLQTRARPAHIEAVERRARRGIDAVESRGQAAIRNGAREEARRVARTDLHDARKFGFAHEGVGEGGVEPGKPGLAPTRCGRPVGAEPAQNRQVPRDRAEPAFQARAGGRESRLERGIARRRADVCGVAVGNEESALDAQRAQKRE